MATNNLNILASLKLTLDNNSLQRQLSAIKKQIEGKLNIDVNLNIKNVSQGVSEVQQGTKKISASFAVYKESLDRLIHSYKMKKISDEEFLQKSDQKIKKMSFEKLSWAEQEKIINLTSQAQKKYNTEQNAIASTEATRHQQAMQRANEMQAKIKQNMTQGKGQVYTREYSSPILGTTQNDVQKSISSAIKAFDANAEISKIRVKLNENMNLSTATVSWKDSLGKMIQETMKWKDVVDEQTGQVKRVFKTVSTDITNDIAKMQSANLKIIEDAKKLQQSQVNSRSATNNSLYSQKDTLSANSYKAVEDSLKRIYSLKQQILEADSRGQITTSADLKTKLAQSGLEYAKASQNIRDLGLQNDQRSLDLMREKVQLQNKLNTSGLQQNDTIRQYQQKMQNDITQMKIGKDKVFLDPKVIAELNTLNTMLASMGRVGGSSTKDINQQMSKLGTVVKQVSYDTKQLNKETNSYFSNLKMILGKFSDWMVVGTIFGQTMRQMQVGMKYIYDMDTALTNLSKVVDFSTSQLNDMRVTSLEMGKALAVSSVEVMKAMAEFGRLVKTPEEIKQLTEASLMAANVTSLTADEAAKSISTAMIAFKFEAKDAISVIDRWNELQNNMKVGAIDLADSVSRIGSAAKQAGMSMNDLNSLTAAMVSTTGLSGSEVSTAIKSTISRTFRVGENDEEVGKTEEALKKLGIEVRNENGIFKSFTDIFHELGTRFNEFNDNQQKSITQQIAGTYHYGKIMSVLSNYDQVLKANELQLNAQGSAFEENQKKLYSLEGGVNQFKLALEGIYTTVGNSDTLKSFIDTLTGLVNTINVIMGVFGGFNTLLVAVGASLILFNKSINGVTLGSAFMKNQMIATAVSVQLFTGSTVAARVAVFALQAAMTAGLAFGVTALISGFTYLVGSVVKAREEKERFFSQTREEVLSLEAQEKGLKKLSAEYDALKAKEKNITITASEKQKLLDIQKELVSKYDLAVTGINKEGDAYNDSTVAIKLKTEALKAERLEKIELMKATLKSNESDRNSSVQNSMFELESRQSELQKYKNAKDKMTTGKLSSVKVDGMHDQYGMSVVLDGEELASEIVKTTNRITTLKEKITTATKDIPLVLKNFSDDTVKVMEESGGKLSDSSRGMIDEFVNSIAKRPIPVDVMENKIKEFIGSTDFKKFNNLTNEFSEAQKGGESKKLPQLATDINTVGEAIKSTNQDMEDSIPMFEGVKNFITGVVAGFSENSKKATTNTFTEDTEALTKAQDKLDQQFKKSVDSVQYLTDAQKELSDNHKLSSKTLEGLLLEYPELIQYMDDESKMSEQISKMLDVEFENQKTLYRGKLEMSTDFFNKVIKGNADTWNAVQEAYGNDAESFRNVADAKLRMNAAVVELIGKQWSEVYATVEEGAKDALSYAYNQLNNTSDPEAKAGIQQTIDGLQKQIDLYDKLNKPIDLTLNKIDFKKLDTKDIKPKAESSQADVNEEAFMPEINRMERYERHLSDVNVAIAKNKSEQEQVNLSTEDQIKLKEKELSLLEQQRIGNNNLSAEAKQIASELRGKMGEKFFSQDGNINLDEYNKYITNESNRINGLKGKSRNDANTGLKNFEADKKAYESMLSKANQYEIDKSNSKSNKGKLSQEIDKNKVDDIFKKQADAIESYTKELANKQADYESIPDNQPSKKLINLNEQDIIKAKAKLDYENQIKELQTTYMAKDENGNQLSQEQKDRVHDQAEKLRGEISNLVKDINKDDKLKIKLFVEASTEEFTQANEKLDNELKLVSSDMDKIGENDFGGKLSNIAQQTVIANKELNNHEKSLEALLWITNENITKSQDYIDAIEREKLAVSEGKNKILDFIKTSQSINTSKATYEIDQLGKSFEQLSSKTDALKSQQEMLNTFAPNNYSAKNALSSDIISSTQNEISKIKSMQLTYINGIEDAKREGNVETVKLFTDKLKEAYDTERSLIMDNAKQRRQLLEDQFSQQNLALEKTLFNGSTADDEKDKLNTLKQAQDLYVSGNEKSYELDLLKLDLARYNNDIQNSKISIFDTQISQMERMSQISRNELETLQKQVAIKKLELELDNVKSEKTIKVLRKQDDGSYKFQFEADQKKILDIQANLDSAKIDAEKTQRNIDIQNQENVINQKEEFMAKVKDIQQKALDGEYSTQQQFTDAMTKLYEKLDGKYATMWNGIRTTQAGASNIMSTAWDTMKTSYGGFTTDMSNFTSQLSTSIQGSANATLSAVNALVETYNKLNELKRAGGWGGGASVSPTQYKFDGTPFVSNNLASPSITSNLTNMINNPFGSSMSAADATVMGPIKLKKFDTGGYTSSSEGVAYLDKKESILNSEDTKRMLEMVSMARNMPNITRPNIPLLPTNNTPISPVNNYNINVDKIQTNNAKSLLDQLTRLTRSS